MTAAASTRPLARLTDTPDRLGDALRFFLARPSPRILLAALAAALAARVAVGGVSLWDLAPPLVVLAYWPLNEWLIHVFILHAKPFRILGRTIDPAVPRKHRAHHRDPWDLELVFIPLHAFVYTLPALVGVCFLLTPTPQLALTALLVYLALSLRYEWMHFIAHTRYTPQSARAQALIRNHRLHHFKNEHYWYGVSMLAADRPLGTSPDPERIERSDTARTLGIDAA